MVSGQVQYPDEKVHDDQGLKYLRARVWITPPGKSQRSEEVPIESKGYLERIIEGGHDEYQLWP